MGLSRKVKLFCQFFIANLEYTLNFEGFKKNIRLAYVYLKFLTSKNVEIKGPVSETPSAVSELVSCKKLLKSAEKDFYRNFLSLSAKLS